jgi:hypothetical protein
LRPSRRSLLFQGLNEAEEEKMGSSRISGKAIANTGFDKKNVVLA